MLYGDVIAAECLPSNAFGVRCIAIFSIKIAKIIKTIVKRRIEQKKKKIGKENIVTIMETV